MTQPPVSAPSRLTASPVVPLSQPSKLKSPLLSDEQRSRLQQSLLTPLRPEYRRRIEIMLLADQGYSQTQICERLGCSHETARYWIAIAKAGCALQWRDRPMGRPKVINAAYRDRLHELATRSPKEFGYPFRRWSAHWLAKHLETELGIKISTRYVNYLLKEMGLSTRRPRAAVSSASPSS